MTITEALAEIKTISKRITSKREFIRQYMVRAENVKDPLEKDGGSVQAIAKEMQAIRDLEIRLVSLRRAIQKANVDTTLSIEGMEQSIADWIVWRREVSPIREKFLYDLRSTLTSVRDNLRRQGFTPNATTDKPSDIVVSINEIDLAAESEKMSNILGQLDGQLSLKNATVMLDI